MKTLYSLYKNALFWNIQSALLYKILLITHQTCLFYIAPIQIFGHAGTLFASLFFFISITNFGFDYSLISLFSQHTQQNKISIPTFLVYKILSTCVVGYSMWYAYSTLHIPYITFLFQGLSPFLIFSYISLYITESIKKTVALHADLSFQNKQHFFIEIGCLIGYLCSVWGIYFYNQTITITTLLIPFSVWSFLECLLLFWYVQKTILPQSSHTIFLPGDQPLNYLNQLFKTLYSSNSLFMMLSWHYGFAKVGFIKLLLDILSFLHTFLYRTIGTPLAALYARTKKIPELLPALTSYSQTLGLVWLCVITALYSWHYFYSPIDLVVTLFFLITISFLDYAQIPYEKILLVHHAGVYIFMYYLVGMAIAGIIYYLGILLHITLPFIFFICMNKMYTFLFMQKNANRLANL